MVTVISLQTILEISVAERAYLSYYKMNASASLFQSV